MADFNEQVLVEARRRFDAQNQRLDELRGRSVNLLGFAAVVAGLFGVPVSALHHGWNRALAITALGAFAVVVVLATTINRRIPDWDDGEKLDRWFAWRQERDLVVNDFEFNLALRLNDARTANARLWRSMVRRFNWLCLVLAFQVVCGAAAVLL